MHKTSALQEITNERYEDELVGETSLTAVSRSSKAAAHATHADGKPAHSSETDIGVQDVPGTSGSPDKTGTLDKTAAPSRVSQHDDASSDVKETASVLDKRGVSEVEKVRHGVKFDPQMGAERRLERQPVDGAIATQGSESRNEDGGNVNAIPVRRASTSKTFEFVDTKKCARDRAPKPKLLETLDRHIDRSNKAMNLSIVQISGVGPYRDVHTILRGDFVENEKEKRRCREYLLAANLSEESIYAVDCAIGSVLRDGDTLCILYAIERRDEDPAGQFLDEKRYGQKTGGLSSRAR